MSEDHIKRSDAIEVVSISCRTCLARDIEDCKKCSVPRLRELINAIPSADRPQGWIPCSERLPIDGQYVIIQYYDTVGKNHVSVIGACYDERQGFVDTGYGEAWFGDGNDDVLAWMPLPEPWKGADDDTD